MRFLVEKKEDIDPKKHRLFYELGHYRSSTEDQILMKAYKEEDWFRSGEFKEIKDIEHFLENDNRLNDPQYIKHHNFQIELK